MTLKEIKEQVMFQTNNDADDLEDYLPHINDYINEGYDRLISAWARNHVPAEEFQSLQRDTDIPAIPYWTHRALADYATWMVYRNGNPQKQQRGTYFLRGFQDVLTTISEEGGKDGLNPDGIRKRFNMFANIPV